MLYCYMDGEQKEITIPETLRKLVNHADPVCFQPESTAEVQLLQDVPDLLRKSSNQIGKRWRRVPDSARKFLGAKNRRDMNGNPSPTERAAIMAALFLGGYVDEKAVHIILDAPYTGDEFWTFLEICWEEGFTKAAGILVA